VAEVPAVVSPVRACFRRAGVTQMTPKIETPGESMKAAESLVDTGGSRKHRRSFLRQFVAAPGTVGAVAPSSAYLAKKMVGCAGLEKAGVVLEYGPGTGAFTGEIVRRLRPGCWFAAIELNEAYCEILRKKFPVVRVINDSATNVEAICREAGLGDRACVDAVISGLPWASFPEGLQDELLGAMLRVLRPGGEFVTFGYQVGTWMPAGKRFQGKIRRLFSTVERSELVWRNLPPAYVFRCVTAGGDGAERHPDQK